MQTRGLFGDSVASTVFFVLCVLGITFAAHLLPSDESILSEAVLHVEPSVVKRSGDNVTLAWTGVPNPQKTDFIGIYTPANEPDQDEISKLDITQAKTWAQGHGVLQISLINMRTDYEFRYVRVLGKDAKTLMKSPIIRFLNVNEPMQGHLSLGYKPSEMTLMWVTNSSSPEPIVKYGIQRKNYQHSATGHSRTYSRNELCGGDATGRGWRFPGILHEVVMTDLEPDQTYYYIFGNDQHGWSVEHEFRTMPLKGQISENKKEVEIIAFGDMGVFGGVPYSYIAAKETSHWIKNDVLKNGFGDLVLHIGDISYARGFGYIWDMFFASIEPVATRIPYMVCVGNHEYDWPGIGFRPEWGNYGKDSGGECGIPYDRRFGMPAPVNERSRRNWWYSFDYGPIHFVLMSTEHNFTKSSEQYQWLKQDLENIDREATPWVIFSGHRPMYTSAATKGILIQDQFREEIEDLLVKHQVNLALWGHIHAYERTCPIYRGECKNDNKFPVHVVIGMAGHSYQVPWKQPKPAWSVYRSRQFGYTKITVDKNKLNFKYVCDADGSVLDEFEIYQ